MSLTLAAQQAAACVWRRCLFNDCRREAAALGAATLRQALRPASLTNSHDAKGDQGNGRTRQKSAASALRPWRTERAAIHFAGRRANQRRTDMMRFLRERAEQRPVADDIDDARNAAAQTMHFAQRGRSENLARWRRRPSGDD